MKATYTCMAVLAVLCASGAAAQADTATTGGTTPALTQDTVGTGTLPTPAATTVDTAGLGAATTTADTSVTTTAPAPVMTEDTAIVTTTTTSATEEDEGGFDWNWLGLLGLVGLTGLFKRRGTTTEVVHHDTVRPAGRNDPSGTRPRV